MKYIALVILLVSLSACETTVEMNERMINECDSHGFQRNTVYHANCVMNKVELEKVNNAKQSRFLMAYGQYMMNGQQ